MSLLMRSTAGQSCQDCDPKVRIKNSQATGSGFRDNA